MEPTLPPEGHALRTATADDAGPLAVLINEINVAEVGVPWLSVEEVRDILTRPTRHTDDHTVLLGRDDALIGYLMMFADDEPFTTIQLLSFVPPALWGRGLNAWLLRLGEERARTRLAGAGVDSVALRVARWTTNDPAIALFTDLGYRPIRTFHELRIDLDRPPQPPLVPAGLVVGPFEPARDAERVYAAIREAFDDHWGHTFEPFEDWAHEELRSATFDPGLWFVAVDGDDVAGAISARRQTAGRVPAIYVSAVGVRRPWRGRGIARALLLSVFGEANRRGVPAVELGVDSENATGATHLYESVGMRVIRTNEVWEKTLVRT
jgi:mycothiol synthase